MCRKEDFSVLKIVKCFSNSKHLLFPDYQNELLFSVLNNWELNIFYFGVLGGAGQNKTFKCHLELCQS